MAGRRGELAAAWNFSLATGENRMEDDCGWHAAETANRFFEGDTLVKMADGSWRKISELRVGDRVLAVPHGSVGGAATACEVTAIESGTAAAWQLTFANEACETLQFTASEGHPFYVDGRGWVDVKELLVGDIIVTQNGSTFTLSSKTFVEQVVTWSLTVAEKHTFFVGDGLGNEVVVHNGEESAVNQEILNELALILSDQGRLTPKTITNMLNSKCSPEKLLELLKQFRQKQLVLNAEKSYYYENILYFAKHPDKTQEQQHQIFIATVERNRASAEINRVNHQLYREINFDADTAFLQVIFEGAMAATGTVRSYIMNIPATYGRILKGDENWSRGPCANWCSNFTLGLIGQDLFPNQSWTNARGTFRISQDGGETNFSPPQSWIWPSHFFIKVEQGYTDSAGFHSRRIFFVDNGVYGGETGIFSEVPK